ncbi:hypothetical protein M231_02637 [Tremella mesenterica]|uniref:CoA-binding domain-containing protein n=1 Tax=Tremella mesenterica TaxID=5217 RepID=A0A4V1M4D6_TREME|nr:hypothetical protein M231_02637 [Tremella mesenterica]
MSTQSDMLNPAMKSFILAPRFAVIGRILSDPTRFDNKVLRFYLSHSLPVTPIKPQSSPQTPSQISEETIEGLSVLSDIAQLGDITNTAISVIIRPDVGVPMIKRLFTGENQPWGVWFQPGAENEELDKFVKENKLEDKVIYGGPCILRS